ncbi:alpha/beta fold hydrolase [Paraburkholderia bryophila]|uniref:Pimeloyl-ACP methyl ester carboxylesterase n=1 Tax=Paraburkholderia bryophila TaxID=420952 RepID=A0A7Y9WS41_9BURK|nr:alpha/beta hydrolase [Paraburkholderia bryophila]NYH25976.1 pimeloyl-ACP methyl ester carboxylesterase [Paraburkholderia bryophila]
MNMSSGYVTAPNQYVTVDGVRLAYRSIGSNSNVPPLVLFHHFTATMDDWDSALIDGLAKQRRVIILGNPGIGASGGSAPDSVTEMARFSAGFIDALDLKSVDVMGYSIGGAVAQQVATDRPELLRKIILAGSGPRGGEGIANLQTVISTGFAQAEQMNVHPKVALFFTTTTAGITAGNEFVKRINNHTVDVEEAASQEAMGAQAKALITWGMSPSNFEELANIKQPVLIVNGKQDLIIPTVNSYVLYQHLANARLVLYPESGHGALFQFHESFVAEVNTFLDGSN